MMGIYDCRLKFLWDSYTARFSSVSLLYAVVPILCASQISMPYL